MYCSERTDPEPEDVRSLIYEEKKDPMRDLFPEPPSLQSNILAIRPLIFADAPDLLRLTGQ